jgi:hypothetical protein
VPWQYGYTEASTSAPPENVQTTTVPPGGAANIEMKVGYPGHYILVDHALSRVGKGAAGVLQVTGEKNPASTATTGTVRTKVRWRTGGKTLQVRASFVMRHLVVAAVHRHEHVRAAAL